jgi:hypothetical protein
MFLVLEGHQANLSYSSQPGIKWDLYVDPDYSWPENGGEYVVEKADSDSIVLRDQRSGERKVLNRREVEIIRYSRDRGY